MRFFFTLTLCCLLMACSTKHYDGPVSAHYDGERFVAIEPIAAKNLWTVLKWRLTTPRTVWPVQKNLSATDKPPARVQDKFLRVSFVNHSTVLLQTRGLNILTDPIWAERASPFSFLGPKRVHPPGIAWADLPRIDIALISHSHYDHLNIETIQKLSERDNTLFVVPLGVDDLIKKQVKNVRLHVMDWHDAYTFNEDMSIISEPVQHWSARGLFDRNRTLWTAYVLKLPDGNIYFAGDTGYGSGKVFHDTFAKHGKMRLALLPIGAYAPRWFMKEAHTDPSDAVKIFQDVDAAQAVAIHFDTFQLGDEAYGQAPKDLAEALKKAGIPFEKFRALKPGVYLNVD